jgi:hypothetical protein
MATDWLSAPRIVALSYWRQATFAEGREYEIAIGPGPAGAPGERLVAPSPSLYRPRIGAGWRDDFAVVVDRRGTSLKGVCLGPETEHGQPEQVALENLTGLGRKGWIPLAPMSSENVGGARAVHYAIERLHGPRLAEWLIARDGWLYRVTSFARSGGDTTLPRIRSILDTWQWIPASASE